MLERRILSLLLLHTQGYKWGSTDHIQIQERLAALGQEAQTDLKEDDSNDGPNAAKYEKLFAQAFFELVQGGNASGVNYFVAITPELLSQAYRHQVEFTRLMNRAVLVGPDLAAKFVAELSGTIPLIFTRINAVQEFDKEIFAGIGGCKLRVNIESYDFEMMHAAFKRTGFDFFLFGVQELASLLWFGDLTMAKAGWVKQIDAWKRVKALVQSGDRAWSDYLFETSLSQITAAMLMAEEMEMLREFIPHTFDNLALHDPQVQAQLETMYQTAPFAWEGPDGRCFWRVETIMLRARALAAVADNGDMDSDALRTWLPRPDALVYIAEHEFIHSAHCAFGASHPALLCATLYARLGEWHDAEAIVQGILAIPSHGDGVGFGVNPTVRIEAWRLLARCRGVHGGSSKGALEALEHAVSESRAQGYLWMESVSLRDMLQWVEGTAEEASVHTQIAAVTSVFGIGKV